MVRNLVVGVGVALLVVSCGTSRSDAEPSTKVTTSTTIDSSTTSVVPSSTTTASSSTTAAPATTTTTLSHDLGVWGAPADGQWFNELPIPWVYPVEPPIDQDGVPGSMGWTREEAVVTVNGHRTDSEWCDNCMYQRGRLWQWRSVEGEGDASDWETGGNPVVFGALFGDGVVFEETRTIYYDPSLESFTGWMVGLDQYERTITFAASTYAPAEEDGADTGPVTSVSAYTVRNHAAFILLGVKSSGEPPPSAISFDEFADLTTRAQAGECQECFFASWPDSLFAEPDSEHGAHYFWMYLKDGEVQQLEQIWSP